MPADTLPRLRQQAHAAYVIAKKDAIIYYLKAPVISFGIVFPLFFYLAFAAGRSVPTETMVPGIVAMGAVLHGLGDRTAGDSLGTSSTNLRAAGALAGLSLCTP